MRAVLVLVAVFAATVPARAQDALGEARRHYNAGQYDAAVRAARTALDHPASAHAARVVLGRAYLERFRQSAAASDLTDARTFLRGTDPAALDDRERMELTLGFGEALFLEERFAAAADMLAPLLDVTAPHTLPSHDRVIDWWATALDRYAQTRAPADRAPIYQRIVERMNHELARNPGSAPASYWLVAATRGTGDLDSAWSAAMAAWIRGALARDRGAALRGDLDRLVIQGLVPERAARTMAKDSAPVLAGMLAEWESFKASWSR